MATLSYADNCENARNTYDDIYCTNKIFASADADLNKNYQQLRKQLSDTQQKILKKSHLTDPYQNKKTLACLSYIENLKSV